MDRLSTFQDFLSGQTFEIPTGEFLINLIMAAVLAHIVSQVYIKFGRSLSNRKLFARNFVLIALTTTLIITIVKSSLALSLGLVGALSIVRFRAAIKEPEELAYLFLIIGVGLGFGADQARITIIAFTVIFAAIMLYSRMQKKAEDQNLNLVISGKKSKNLNLEQISKTLNSHCEYVNLRRFDENANTIEAAFLVECEDFSRLSKIKSELQKLSRNLNVTFLDNKGAL